MLAEGCVPADSRLPRNIGPSDEEVTAAVQISACAAPTEALRAAWCEVNRAVCTDPTAHPSPTACGAIDFDELCAWYPPSDRSLAELLELGADAAVDPATRNDAGSDSGAGAPSAEQDAGPPGRPATVDDDQSSHDCSAVPGTPAARLPLLLVLFALMTLARRRLGS
jgi:hypothetical protein